MIHPPVLDETRPAHAGGSTAKQPGPPTTPPSTQQTASGQRHNRSGQRPAARSPQTGCAPRSGSTPGVALLPADATATTPLLGARSPTLNPQSPGWLRKRKHPTRHIPAPTAWRGRLFPGQLRRRPANCHTARSGWRDVWSSAQGGCQAYVWHYSAGDQGQQTACRLEWDTNNRQNLYV